MGAEFKTEMQWLMVRLLQRGTDTCCTVHLPSKLIGGYAGHVTFYLILIGWMVNHMHGHLNWLADNSLFDGYTLYTTARVTLIIDKKTIIHALFIIAQSCIIAMHINSQYILNLLNTHQYNRS